MKAFLKDILYAFIHNHFWQRLFIIWLVCKIVEWCGGPHVSDDHILMLSLGLTVAELARPKKKSS